MPRSFLHRRAFLRLSWAPPGQRGPARPVPTMRIPESLRLALKRGLALFLVLVLVQVLTQFWWLAPAQALRPLSKGQTVYAPAYSHVYQGALNRSFGLTVLLSVRNVSPTLPLTVTAVQYHDDAGRLAREALATPITLAPLATWEYLVDEKDDAGGSGANFMVYWEAEEALPAPLVEVVMISTRSAQGISFKTNGVVIEERDRTSP